MILMRSLTSAAYLMGLTCVAAAQAPVAIPLQPAPGLSLPAQGIEVPGTTVVPTLVPPTTETLPQPELIPQADAAAGMTSDGFQTGGTTSGQYVYDPNDSGYNVFQPAPLPPMTDDGYYRNAGAHLAVPPPLGLIQPQAYAGGLHERYPYYSYRRPWYTPGPASLNVTIVW